MATDDSWIGGRREPFDEGLLDLGPEDRGFLFLDQKMVDFDGELFEGEFYD